MIEVSAGIVRSSDGRILVCRRGEGRKNAHLWEFPGGKRESGETAASCLIRELREELSLEISGVRELCTGEAQGIRFTFLTAMAESEPRATEHEAIGFVRPREMLPLDFCPADTEVARRLALSDPPLTRFMWDFDGTLMDTYGSLTQTVLRACGHFGFTPDPVRVLDLLKVELRRCLAVLAEENGLTPDELRAAYLAESPLEDPDVVQPLPGIPELLRALSAAGARHYVVTHRSLATCERMLENHGLLGLFDDMVTGDDPLPRKPAPDRCLEILRRHAIPAEHAVMIGDRPLDITSGHGAGVLTVMLDPENRFPDTDADLRVSSAAELGRLLQRP